MIAVWAATILVALLVIVVTGWLWTYQQWQHERQHWLALRDIETDKEK